MPDQPLTDTPLARSYSLAHGLRVRLRIAQSRDVPRIAALLARCSQHPDAQTAEMTARRIVHGDPRRRVAICATALIDRSQRVLGVGVIDVGAGSPDLLCAEEGLAPGLRELLRQALLTRARRIRERPAA